MTLRWIHLIKIAFVFCLFFLHSAAFCEEAKRPNIVFAFADDWGRYASAYGKLEPGGLSDLVKTPNFDRVAAEGVLFTKAFVNAPSCTPCRSALLTGRHFYRTKRGAILRPAFWDGKIPSYPLMLEEKGYHIGFTYKVWSPGKPRDEPHGGKKKAYHVAGTKFNKFSQTVSKAKNKKRAKKKLFNEVAGNFKSFLNDREEGQPFCYFFGPTNCHRKWTYGSGESLWNIKPDDFKGKMPSFLPDVETIRTDFADYFGEVQAFDAALGVLLAELEKSGELENTIIVVSGDHGIPGFPRAKCNLYDFGLAVPLAIRWPNKVKPNRVVDDFVSLIDLAPTFLEAAGEKPLKEMDGRSLMNVLTSDKSGTVDPTRDHVIAGRERHVEVARIDFMPYPQRSIRTKDFLYIRNLKPDRWPVGMGPGYGRMVDLNSPIIEKRSLFSDIDGGPTKAWFMDHLHDPEYRVHCDYAFAKRPAEELYDLAKDPDQINNVAADSNYAKTREKLSARLMKILKDTHDPRTIGDGDMFDKLPYTSPRRDVKLKR